MTEPPERPRPLFADEEIAPARPLAVPPSEPFPTANIEPPEDDEPPRSRTGLTVAVVILAVLSLLSGGAAAWEYTSGSSSSSDLSAQLDAANAQLSSASAQVDALNSQLADLQSQLDASGQSATDQLAQIKKLKAQAKKLRAQVAASLPSDTFPVVVYEGVTTTKVKNQFQKQLIDPMTAAASQPGSSPLISIWITIPANDGDPYTYYAVFANGGYDTGSYGAKGSPLPAWGTGCDSGCG